MVHGAIENGKIFYTNSGKGLACYLAKQGFDVYVLDCRGRGQSHPAINSKSCYGQTDTITKDLPHVIQHLQTRTGKACHLVAHSWGGVLLASTLVRYPELRNAVLSMVCFGTKRSVSVHNPERWLKLDLVWRGIAPWLCKRFGFLDAKRWQFGSDSETSQSLKDSLAWVRPSAWVDPNDGFDYQAAARQLNWPPLWHIAAKKDAVLGHPKDVQRFARECAGNDFEYTLLSQKNNHLLDYDHINMLTHPKAQLDHFPLVREWLLQQTPAENHDGNLA